MPTNIQKLESDKERILNFIKVNGPSLPVKISKSINNSPLFTSAFLAELHTEKKLKMSKMKIGSSPLYHLPGQEADLANFAEYLVPREREAFSLLKEKQILEDEKQEPVIRVALRAISDFANPLRVRIKEEVKLFWKYYLISDEQAQQQIQDILNQVQSRPKIQEQPKPAQQPIPKPQIQETKQIIKEISKKIPQHLIQKTKQETKPASKKTTSKFSEKIQDYLKAKDIELLSILSEKKKEFTAKIRTDTIFGKQTYRLTAKDKKKITEDDITLAIQKAQTEKMTALIMTTGEVEKKSRQYLKEWENLVKIEKIKIQ